MAGVDVQLGRTITAADVDAYEPDAIVVATGATPRRDGFQAWVPGQPLPGIDQVELLTGWDVLEGAELAGPVLLVDELGHYESFDVSEALVKRGLEVHHVTRFHSLGAAIPLNYEFAAAPHTEELMKGDFHLHTRSLVVRVAPGSATITHLDARDREQQLAVEHFVFMSGHVPDDIAPAGPRGTPERDHRRRRARTAADGGGVLGRLQRGAAAGEGLATADLGPVLDRERGVSQRPNGRGLCLWRGCGGRRLRRSPPIADRSSLSGRSAVSLQSGRRPVLRVLAKGSAFRRT